jgi:hypothetical protein
MKIMKTILKNMLGWGSALALVAGCTSTAVVPGNKAAMVLSDVGSAAIVGAIVLTSR